MTDKTPFENALEKARAVVRNHITGTDAMLLEKICKAFMQVFLSDEMVQHEIRKALASYNCSDEDLYIGDAEAIAHALTRMMEKTDG